MEGKKSSHSSYAEFFSCDSLEAEEDAYLNGLNLASHYQES